MNRGSETVKKVWIGIDNGVTGSIGIVDNKGVSSFHLTPVFKTLNYQKKAKNLNRVDTRVLNKLLKIPRGNFRVLALIERPMVNPGRFQASLSAIRALESTLIILERRGIPYQFVDSKEWQKVMLPAGIKGADKLKKASLDVGKRLFPQFKFKKDADGILIAEWARRTDL